MQQIDVIQRGERIRNSDGSYELDPQVRASNSDVPIISEVTIDNTVVGRFLSEEAPAVSRQETMKIQSPKDTA